MEVWIVAVFNNLFDMGPMITLILQFKNPVNP